MTSAARSGFDLAGRVIVVTGGAKGLGKVYSRKLAQAGARVVVADVEPEANEEVVAGIRDDKGEAIAAATDVSDQTATEAMARAAIDHWGRIDGLINNAALMSVLPRRAWHEIDVNEWDEVMSVNLRGMFLCCKAVYPHMKAQGYGKIVNVGSSRIFEGTPFRLHYTTSKGGVVSMTRALARELGDDNIMVNCLSPGLTLSETQLQSSDPKYLSSHGEGRALKRAQLPDDLIGALFFLLSSASDFMTGQTINVDGGRAMH